MKGCVAYMGSIIDSRGNKCPICDRPNIEIDSCGEKTWYRCYSCPDCGEFFAHTFWQYDTGLYPDENLFKDNLRIYLFYHKSKMRPFICSEDAYRDIDKTRFVDIYNLSPNMVSAWYPKCFADKVDYILLKLDELSEYDGAYLNIEPYADKLFFCSQNRCKGVKEGCDKTVQLIYVTEYLQNSGYIDHKSGFLYQLTPKAHQRIYELRRNQTKNKNVFVSMAFNDGTKQTREAIREAIVQSGYSPEFIDEIIHNKQIVPEMFRLIRESRFLILEISDPNYGAYYEAGYALGLGKEVIICCSEEVFTKEYETVEEKKYAKYLRPHFDIAQQQILIWKNKEDLIKKLCEWIKALF